MARACSDDLRRKFPEACEHGEGSLAKVAGRLHVSVGCAKRISATLSRTGKKELPSAGKRGRKSRITVEAAKYLRRRVEEQPDRTLAGLSQKKSLHASERESERVRTQRRFRQREARAIDPAQFVFVDESGVTDDWRRPVPTLSSDKLTFAVRLWQECESTGRVAAWPL